MPSQLSYLGSEGQGHCVIKWSMLCRLKALDPRIYFQHMTYTLYRSKVTGRTNICVQTDKQTNADGVTLNNMPSIIHSGDTKSNHRLSLMLSVDSAERFIRAVGFRMQ